MPRAVLSIEPSKIFEKMIEYASNITMRDAVKKRAAVVGQGFPGPETAQAIQGLQQFPEVTLI